jgi:hypothetical protein
MPTPTDKFLWTSVRYLGLLFVPLALLTGCAGSPRPAPTLLPPATPAETQTTEAIELFDRYSVVGIDRDSSLTIHQEPSLDSPLVGQIPYFGSDIQPTGQIHQEENSTWLFIQYQELGGWVEKAYLAEQHGSLPEELNVLGKHVLEILKTEQYNQLIPLIHPDFCLQFSPYQYLPEDSQRTCPSQLESFIRSEEPLTWGHYDGSGEPIVMPFIEYQQRFIYDQDYLWPWVVGFNEEVSSGNSINNISDIFPDGMMIEYYFPGFDPQYGGMDWRSLRLVFVERNGHWYLTAIIHGEWTI